METKRALLSRLHLMKKKTKNERSTSKRGTRALGEKKNRKRKRWRKGASASSSKRASVASSRFFEEEERVQIEQKVTGLGFRLQSSKILFSFPKRQHKKKSERNICLLPANRVGDFSSRKRSADRSSPAPAGTTVRFLFVLPWIVVSTVSLSLAFVLVFRATIESFFSNSVIKFILTRASYHYYFLHSGERDQRLAKLPEVSTSDGSIRDGVLRAE